jgi:hypothetical protein
MTDQTVVINRQDPAIEAYRLGLLGDVQGYVQSQILGQNVQNLRAQGLSNKEIAERLSTPASGKKGEPGYRPAVKVSASQVKGISDSAMFGPPGYQVAQLSPAERAGIQAAQQGVGAYAPFLSGGSQMISQGQSLLAGQAVPAMQQAMGTMGAGQGFIDQGAQLAAAQRGLPFEEQQRAGRTLRQGLQTGMDFGQQGIGQLAQGIGAGQQAAGAGIAGLSGTGGRFRPDQITPFMNQFEDAAVQQALSDIGRQGQIQRQQVGAQAVGAGAFGGSRQAVAEQELGRNILDQQGRTAAQMRTAGFESAAQSAQQAFEQQQARRQQAANITGQLGLTASGQQLTGGQNIGALGTNLGQLGLSAGQAQGQLGVQFGQLGQQDVAQLLQMAQQQQGLGQGLGALAGQYGQLGTQLGQLGVQQGGIAELTSRLGTQDINNLLATGGLERQVDQATLDALRMTNLQQYSQPLQMYGFLSDIYSGVPTGQMTTTAASAPQISPFQTAAGLGIQGLSAVAGAQRAGIL